MSAGDGADVPRIERYVLAGIARAFGYALGIFVVFFAIGGSYELLRNGVPAAVALRLVPFAILYMLPLLIAISVAIGCAVSYGRLSADNELLAALAGGVHPLALLRPAAYVGLVLSLLAFGLQASVAPYAYAQKRRAPQTLVRALLADTGPRPRTLTDRRSLALRWQRREGERLEQIEVLHVPPRRPAASTGEAALGTVGFEAVAQRAVLRPEEKGGLRLRLEGADLEVFEPRPWRLALLDRDGDGRLGVREWPASEPFERFDRDGDRWLDRAEARAAFAQLDPREGRRGRGDRLQLEALELRLEPRRWRKLLTSALSTRRLMRQRARLVAWQRWAREGGARRLVAARCAAALAAVAAPGAAPLVPIAAAAQTLAHPSPALQQRVQRRMWEIDSVVYERVSLAIAPLLFALVAAPLPLLWIGRNWLVSLLASMAILLALFLVPWLVARAQDPDCGLPALALYAPGWVLTALVAAALLVRVARR
ncbi:MAG: LptF/LptG family permease [Planctomycetota bacterium]|nr:MAG: LptF/LptG family permease [Planctomycetota bacterium]